MEGMIPISLALTITPTVPVTLSLWCLATLRARKSSRIIVESGIYKANAIALASPLSN